MLKDHKPVPSGRPLRVRPVCGADLANNQQLSQILVGIVTKVTEIMDKEIKSTCRSTEEMCHAIEEVNKTTDIKDLVIFSTDVSGMYPNGGREHTPGSWSQAGHHNQGEQRFENKITFPQAREPSREETRVMFKLAFEILINEAMKEHMYFSMVR